MRLVTKRIYIYTTLIEIRLPSRPTLSRLPVQAIVSIKKMITGLKVLIAGIALIDDSASSLLFCTLYKIGITTRIG